MSRTQIVSLYVAVTLLVVMAGIVGGLYGMHLEKQDKADWRQLCDRLDAEYVTDPHWMCIRDGKVVYQ